jgi:acyl-CoA thioesterase-1
MARFHRKRSDTACTYGRPLRIINGAVFQAMTFAAAVLAVSLLFSIPAQARDEPVIVAFGDSLSAGYGLADAESFPVQLERALQESGLSATVVNSGVSGDTTAGGRARLAWSIPPEADLVILELGANDGLRGIDPAETEANLDAMLAALAARDTKVLFAGMLAPPNLGRDYGAAFNAAFPRLAEKYNVAFYPFFLDGVAADPTLNQRDGIHPNAEGVARIVDRITPYVLTALGRSASGSQ